MQVIEGICFVVGNVSGSRKVDCDYPQIRKVFGKVNVFSSVFYGVFPLGGEGECGILMVGIEIKFLL